MLMKNNILKKYIPPTMSVQVIYLEDSITVGSTTSISGGNATDQYTPDVTDWTDPDSETNGFEF